MPKEGDDGLFLLEVLIEKIRFLKSPCFSDKDFRTCVKIECHSVEPLEICDDDPGAACVNKCGGPFEKTFNNGKSCLFSLHQADIDKAMSKFPVKVTVYKSLPCGCLPTKIVLGEATIDMTKEFIQARKKYLEDPSTVCYEALKDTFRIVGADQSEAGDITMFLRISCFGKLIVTRFQGSAGPPTLGTGRMSGVVDRSCNPPKEFQTQKDPCSCGAARGGAGGSGRQPPCTSGGSGFGPCPGAKDPYNSMPCEMPDDPCYCSGPRPAAPEAMTCRNTGAYCLHVPKDCCPTGNKVIFQMPSDTCGNGHKQRAHFNLKDGVGDLSRDDPGQLMPITSPDYPGVVYDFPKQVIKLRIGKVVEMPGALPSLPLYQELSEEQIHEIKMTSKKEQPHLKEGFKHNMLSQYTQVQPQAHSIINDWLKTFLSTPIATPALSELSSLSSICTQSRRRSISISNTVDYIPTAQDERLCFPLDNNLFGDKETTVYMTLFDEQYSRHAQGTQATASINKCLQARRDNESNSGATSRLGASSTDWLQSSPSIIRTENYLNDETRSGHCQDIFFFQRKKSKQHGSGMGSNDEQDSEGYTKRDKKYKSDEHSQHICKPVNTCHMNSGNTSNAYVGGSSSNNSSNVAHQSSYAGSTCHGHVANKGTTYKSRGGTNVVQTATTTTGGPTRSKIKSVSIECPVAAAASAGIKGDMMATVSHIKITPRESCPIHGREPCSGPKCIIASQQDSNAPVKISTMSNPRRGVFELVIRRMTGAPLAKNELMLEWTPPPSRGPPCGSPCPYHQPMAPCHPRPCSQSKCRMIVCRATPRRPKRRCKTPCGPMPCRTVCQKCCKSVSCGGSCGSCKPKRSLFKPRCEPCCKSSCGVPCSSSPCLLPCRRRARKCCSQPRFKPRKKCMSPCFNREKVCPVARCRSLPGPCLRCYLAASVSSTVGPCKPPSCCKSSCSTCCQ